MERVLEILIMTNQIFHCGEKYRREIMEISPNASLMVVEQGSVTSDMIEKAEVIFGWPKPEQIQAARNLKWLHLPSAGADRYTDKSLYCNQDIVLTNSSGVFGLPIAEHVFGMILAFNKNLQTYAYNKEKKVWKGMVARKDFYGSTIGIIGLGDIGTEIAKRAHAWGAKVLAVKRTPGQVPEYVDELYRQDGIDTLLERSDYVVLALPNTAKTQGIISEERLRRMKSDAFLVNIGRGGLIDQEALIKALKEGWIAGAGLDVASPEPLPKDSPLWELPNVIITPHTSGGSPTNDERRFSIFNRNLRHYIEDKPLENLVSFDEGY